MATLCDNTRQGGMRANKQCRKMERTLFRPLSGGGAKCTLGSGDGGGAGGQFSVMAQMPSYTH